MFHFFFFYIKIELYFDNNYFMVFFFLINLIFMVFKLLKHRNR